METQELKTYTGTVKFFNRTTGYGMISPDDKMLTISYEKKDIMAHTTKVIGGELQPSGRVEFNILDSSNMKYDLLVPDVRYDKTLSDEAKELHRIISVLCNGKSSCLRSNKYLASSMNILDEKLDRVLDELITKEYLNIQRNEVGLKAFNVKKIPNGSN